MILIKEGKQIGNLYHILGINSLLYIIKNNKLKGLNYPYISTTRNKMFNDYLGGEVWKLFKLELDGDKLSNKYKIEPYSFENLQGRKFSEYEEVIKTKEIINIFSYVNKFIIIKDNIESINGLGDNFYSIYDDKLPNYNNRYFNANGAKVNLSDIRKLINKLPKNILYIQDKTRVYQDFNYLKNNHLID